MLDPKFIFLGILINAVGTGRYVLDTLRGKTKPNRLAWFLWGAAPIIAFAAEMENGVGLRSITTLWFGLAPLLVFASTFFNPASYWKITRFDFGCAALSVAALGLWVFTQSGNIAIVFSILADGFAGIPIVVKAYRHPETESWLTFCLAGVNACIGLLTVDVLTFANVAFPIYIVVLCTTLVALITRPQAKPAVALS